MGALSQEYYWEIDDPYKVLAHAIVGFYRPADVIRMLTDNAYLLNCITKEVRGLDIGGIFLDCIIEDILAHKKRMEYMHELDELASYYFSQLDKERLRGEIIGVLSEIGIEITQSTAGRVFTH